MALTSELINTKLPSNGARLISAQNVREVFEATKADLESLAAAMPDVSGINTAIDALTLRVESLEDDVAALPNFGVFIQNFLVFASSHFDVEHGLNTTQIIVQCAVDGVLTDPEVTIKILDSDKVRIGNTSPGTKDILVRILSIG